MESINDVMNRSHYFSWKYFLVYDFLLEMQTSTLGRNKFGKKIIHLQTRNTGSKTICFWNKSRDQVDKIIAELYLSKIVPM